MKTTKRSIRIFCWGLLLGALPACRTAGVWDSAKSKLCAAHEKVESVVISATAPLGLPGTIAGGLINAALGLICGAVEVAAETGKALTTTVIDRPSEALGIAPSYTPTPTNSTAAIGVGETPK